MTCYVESPNAEQFIDYTALLSFNGSHAFTPSVVTASSMIDGLDVSRYTASSDGLTTSNKRPGVTLSISDYQASDGYIEFGCHGLYAGLTPSPVIISSQAQRLARELYNVLLSDLLRFYNLNNVDPPSPPVSLTAGYNFPTCFDTVQLAWTPGASDRDIEMYFLSLNGVTLASLGPVTSYTHTTTLQRDTEYTYSVVAMSCAGYSTQRNATSISVGS